MEEKHFETFLSSLENIKFDSVYDKKILYASSYLQMKNDQVLLKILLKLNLFLYLSHQEYSFPIFLIHLKQL